MTETVIDFAHWQRTNQYNLFRTFQRPHFAVTCRLDVTRLMTERKPQGVSPYRACMFAIAHGLHSVDELRMRMRADKVVRFDPIHLSMTVPRDDGSFTFGYVAYHECFETFDKDAAAHILAAREDPAFEPNAPTALAVAYLSCLPWLDFTAVDNALPHAMDCIPRVSWGKITRHADSYQMPMAIQVHHALVDGLHVGQFFNHVQEALDTL